MPFNTPAELIREFAAEVVRRAHHEYRLPLTDHRRSELQGYLIGVLDCALKLGSITQDENQKAKYAVQGDTTQEYWW